jgi:hypothetical protein
MKVIFGILILALLSSCKAQQSITSSKTYAKLQFYSDSCNKFFDYTRTKLNDSLIVEQHNDVSDTLIIKGSKMFKICNGITYKVIDINEDFESNVKKYKYYYFGMLAQDTLQQKQETNTQYSLRLTQSIIIFVPVKKIVLGKREIFMYYTIADCYPASREKCVQAKIFNDQYSVVYFEKEIGYVGFSANQSSCKYMLTEQSYKLFIK